MPLLAEPVSTVLAVCKPARTVPLRLSRLPAWLTLTSIAAPLDGAPAIDMSKVTVSCTGGAEEALIGLAWTSLRGPPRLKVLLWQVLTVPLLIKEGEGIGGK